MTLKPEDFRLFHEQNRMSWNAVTPAHNSHKSDQAQFVREGGCTLFPEELDLLGDLTDRSLLHLQCNCGQDTLSLARRGATVTGVDISDDAVEFARDLSNQSGVPGEFIRSDLFDWFDRREESYDLVFSSYGTVDWLSDIKRWARGVRDALKPGGKLAMVEFHPLVWSLKADGYGRDGYFEPSPILERDGVRDYVVDTVPVSGLEEGVRDFGNPEEAYCFQWTLADTVQALIEAGLRITALREYPYSNGCQVFEGMRELPGRRFTMPEGQPSMPLMFGLTARRD
ncbi:MAG: SAM-dependent methyltransferase [Planctomycetota bacterium]|jgi:SAM-dependent methyltransferase